jgi:hypothetical protein
VVLMVMVMVAVRAMDMARGGLLVGGTRGHGLFLW